MPLPLMLKTVGYMVSIMSVLLLGAAAWDSVDEPALRTCLVLGILTSIVGMGLRWMSSFQDQRERGNI